MQLKTDQFEFVSKLVRDRAAIVLGHGKESLVETRLAQLARKEGFDTLHTFMDVLRNENGSSEIHDRTVDALTTNETSFFRDVHPFEALRAHVLPKIIERRAAGRTLNIWSAAASTGQEAYTIAMLIRENFPQLMHWNVRIVGTDISTSVLSQSKAGVYSQLEVNRGLPAKYLIKYFTRKGNKWHVKDDLKEMIDFRFMNLSKPWPSLLPFDVIFMRNVLIYFDKATRRTILEKIRGCLQPHGSLFLGAVEATTFIDTSWKSVRFGDSSVYQLS